MLNADNLCSVKMLSMGPRIAKPDLAGRVSPSGFPGVRGGE